MPPLSPDLQTIGSTLLNSRVLTRRFFFKRARKRFRIAVLLHRYHYQYHSNESIQLVSGKLKKEINLHDSNNDALFEGPSRRPLILFSLTILYSNGIGSVILHSSQQYCRETVRTVASTLYGQDFLHRFSSIFDCLHREPRTTAKQKPAS